MSIASHLQYKKDETRKLAESMVKDGFKAYIAEGGTYGYFTDGNKVVSFQYDLCGFSFSGNYVSEWGRSCGSGWQLEDSDIFGGLISQTPPYWIRVYDTKWHYTTPEEHEEKYGKACRYKEVLLTDNVEA